MCPLDPVSTTCSTVFLMHRLLLLASALEVIIELSEFLSRLLEQTRQAVVVLGSFVICGHEQEVGLCRQSRGRFALL